MRLSKTEQKECAARALALAEQIEVLRSTLGKDGWPDGDPGFYHGQKMLREVIAFSGFLKSRGIDTPGLPITRQDYDNLRPFVEHVQKTMLIPGTMLGTATLKELDVVLEGRQTESTALMRLQVHLA